MRKPSLGEIAGVVAGAALAVAAGLLSRRASKGAAEPGTDDLPGRVLAAAKRLIPAPPAVLGRGDPAWDDAMGGIKGGEGVWRYYGEGFGTTCGVVAAYIAFLAGLPAELINRDAPEGSGFRVGEHIARLYQGAKALGWLRQPEGGQVDLKPGDIYCTVRSGATWNGAPASGEHVGVVLSVSEPDASGNRTVETADGGQRDANGLQCAKRNTRTLKGETLTLGTGPALVAWWVRTGG